MIGCVGVKVGTGKVVVVHRLRQFWSVKIFDWILDKSCRTKHPRSCLHLCQLLLLLSLFVFQLAILLISDFESFKLCIEVGYEFYLALLEILDLGDFLPDGGHLLLQVPHSLLHRRIYIMHFPIKKRRLRVHRTPLVLTIGLRYTDGF